MINKPLREQVAEAIKNTPSRYSRDDTGWPRIDFGPVADAAIKAVREYDAKTADNCGEE